MNLMILAFFLLVIGSFLLLKISPFDIYREIRTKQQEKQKNLAIADAVKQSKTKKKERYLTRLFGETREILRIMNKTATFNFLLIIAVILFVGGVFLSLIMNNLFIMPVLAIGAALAPFYYIKFTESRFLKFLNTELETALGVITTSYTRGNNNFITAVEENLPYLMPPVCHLFETFIFNVKNVTPNIADALTNLKTGLHNEIFAEWIDTVILTLDNHNLKPTLQPIVNKLSDLRSVTIEVENIMYPPLYEYVCMILLLVSTVPIMYVINRSWFYLLVGTDFGKALLAIGAGTILVTATQVIKHLKPITYKGE